MQSRRSMTPASPRPIPGGHTSGIEFEDISFTYPGGTEPALQGVTFQLERGQSLAVVGPSGAGKSTLASLLLRFWDYSSGGITPGRALPLKEYAQDEVRAKYRLISPSTHFFNTSVRENLRLARRRVTQEEIEAAASKAQIHETVLKMPRGYDTLIGERGQRLSGGERQRLAIARALLQGCSLPHPGRADRQPGPSHRAGGDAVPAGGDARTHGAAHHPPFGRVWRTWTRSWSWTGGVSWSAARTVPCWPRTASTAACGSFRTGCWKRFSLGSSTCQTCRTSLPHGKSTGCGLPANML